MNEQQRRMADYFKTPEGRRKLSESLRADRRRTCSSGILWRWIGTEHVLVGRALQIDHERVSVEYEPGVVVRIQGMTRKEFFRWAPKLHRRFGFRLRHRRRGTE